MKQSILFLVGILFTGNLFALEVGEVAPCVVLDGLNAQGETTAGCIRDQVEEEQQFTILEFFSIDCGACIDNLPKASAIAAEVAGTATVRLVSIDRDLKAAQDFVTSGQHSKHFTFPVAFDNQRQAKKAYGVFSTPTTFILNKANEVVYKHKGSFNEEDVAEIKAIVGAPVVEEPTLAVGDTAPCVVLDGLSANKTEVSGCIRDQVKESQNFTILEFFSTTCSTCQKNLAKMSALSGEVADSATVRFIGVDSAEDVKDFVLNGPLADKFTFPVAFDEDRDALKAYAVEKVPTLFILNKENTVLYRHKGLLKDEDLAEIKAIVTEQEEETPGTLQVGDVAPCVVLSGLSASKQDVNGCIRDQVKDTQSYTILEFFSKDCGYCKRNLRAARYLSRKLEKDATVRLVSIDKDVEEAVEFVTKSKYAPFFTFPTAFDGERDAMKAYGITAVPTTFILNKENEVVYKHVGLLTTPNVKEIVKLVEKGEEGCGCGEEPGSCPSCGGEGCGGSCGGGSGGGCGGGSCGGGSGGGCGGGSCGGGH